MRKVRYLLKRCSLYKCDKPGAYVLDDGRVICGDHARLYAIGTMDAEAEHDRRAPSFDPEAGEAEG